MSVYEVPARDCVSRHDGCPVCSAREAVSLFSLGGPLVRRCASCGMQYLDPYPRDEVMAAFHQFHDRSALLNPMLARYHEAVAKDAPESRTTRTYARILTELARHAAPGTMLDVGCGTGRFLAMSRDRGWRVLGVDSDADVARAARTEHALTVHQGELADLEIPESSLDAITMLDYLEHVLSPVPLIERARTLLRPGGLLVVATPDIDGLLFGMTRWLHAATFGRVCGPLRQAYVPSHPLYFSNATLRRLLDRCGFHVVNTFSDETDLRRLALPSAVKVAVRSVFALAKIVGRRNRTIVIAQKATR